MSQEKKWNELTKLERQAVMDFIFSVIGTEKHRAIDVIEALLNKELKRVDSLMRYNTYVPLLFRDHFDISAVIEYKDDQYFCTDIKGKKDTDITTSILGLLMQCQLNFNEKLLNYSQFDTLVYLLNDVNPRELMGGMISYNKRRVVHKDFLTWY